MAVHCDTAMRAALAVACLDAAELRSDGLHQDSATVVDHLTLVLLLSLLGDPSPHASGTAAAGCHEASGRTTSVRLAVVATNRLGVWRRAIVALSRRTNSWLPSASGPVTVGRSGATPGTARQVRQSGTRCQGRPAPPPPPPSRAPGGGRRDGAPHPAPRRRTPRAPDTRAAGDRAGRLRVGRRAWFEPGRSATAATPPSGGGHGPAHRRADGAGNRQGGGLPLSCAHPQRRRRARDRPPGRPQAHRAQARRLCPRLREHACARRHGRLPADRDRGGSPGPRGAVA